MPNVTVFTDVHLRKGTREVIASEVAADPKRSRRIRIDRDHYHPFELDVDEERMKGALHARFAHLDLLDEIIKWSAAVILAGLTDEQLRAGTEAAPKLRIRTFVR